jgi:hypothetical protein
MRFHHSPALHKIRQLVRFIRRDAVPSRPCRNTPLHGQGLPDPAQFVDSSVSQVAAAQSSPAGTTAKTHELSRTQRTLNFANARFNFAKAASWPRVRLPIYLRHPAAGLIFLPSSATSASEAARHLPGSATSR